MSLAEKVTTGAYNFVYLIVNIILLSLSLLLIIFPVPPADKTQYFLHLNFNSTLQLINDISSDLQKLIKYFNGAAIFVLPKIPFAAFGAGWATMFSNNLALYLKELKLSVFRILFLKVDASSLEWNHKLPVVSE